VPVASGGVGFCTPWLTKVANNSTEPGEAATVGGKVIVEYDMNNRKSLGQTYIVKIAAFHPDRAKKNIGVMAFKRTVCQGGSCEEYKASRCIRCDLDMFPSEFSEKTSAADNLNFLNKCALRLLMQFDEAKIPQKYYCEGEDLLSAQRSLLQF